jgi:hypothetical protein
MTANDRDALDHAIVKLRSLFMAIHGAESIMAESEADALQFLAADTLAAFEAFQASIESAPTLRVA